MKTKEFDVYLVQAGDRFRFHMTNLPNEPWKVYYVIRRDSEDGLWFTLSSLPPNYTQYQAEHFHISAKELVRDIDNGDCVKMEDKENA